MRRHAAILLNGDWLGIGVSDQAVREGRPHGCRPLPFLRWSPIGCDVGPMVVMKAGGA